MIFLIFGLSLVSLRYFLDPLYRFQGWVVKKNFERASGLCVRTCIMGIEKENVRDRGFVCVCEVTEKQTKSWFRNIVIFKH